MIQASMRKKPREPRFGFFVAVSLAIHFIMMLFSGISSSRTARADLIINPVFVQLYSPQQFPGFVKASSGPSTENGSAGTKTEQKALAPAHTSAVKSKPETVALPKDSTKEELKKETSTNFSAGMTEEEKKRLQDALSSIRRDVARGEASGADAEWQGIIGEIRADIVKSAYFQRASEVYKQSWIVPSSVPTDDPNLRVRVVVRIDANGNVMDYQVLSWSGNQALDRSVAKLLDTVKELPAPPISAGAQWFSMGIEFRPFQGD